MNFDPFCTIRSGRGGSGLGLAICRNSAFDVLSGSLDVQSEPGHGTCFTLRFPLA